MKIEKLKQKLQDMIDSCSDKELLLHFYHVLQLEAVKNSEEFSKVFPSMDPEFMIEKFGALEDLEDWRDLDDPLSYEEFKGGKN